MTHVDRYAPSPTSDLHLGNLRTAVAGWLLARAAGGRWLMRVEDLDRERVRAAAGVEARQLRDLRALGLDWDAEIVRQSERLDRYREAVEALPTYECFCTRREIAEASSAPHDGFRPYPGTCRRLTDAERRERRADRPPAIRVDSAGESFTAHDVHAGPVTGMVDDFVLVRNDGQFAYNLAAVVDDVAMGITHITRGEDLLSSAPRQAWLTARQARRGGVAGRPGPPRSRAGPGGVDRLARTRPLPLHGRSAGRHAWRPALLLRCGLGRGDAAPDQP